MKEQRQGARFGSALVAVVGVLVAGCSSGGSAATTPNAPTTPQSIAITSTIDGLKALPQRIHWQARPSVAASQVSEVDFLIDGQVGWTEHNAPYFYADDGNWLVTSFLTPGTHTFEAVLRTTQGDSVSDKVTATITAAPKPPVSLARTWIRNETRANQRAVGSSDGMPTGRWRLTLTQTGMVVHDPQSSGGLVDVRYLTKNRIEFRPTIEHPPYPSPNNGGFCEDTDPLEVYSYILTDGGKRLALRPVSTDPCVDRAALLTGTWAVTAPDPDAARLAAM